MPIFISTTAFTYHAMRRISLIATGQLLRIATYYFRGAIAANYFRSADAATPRTASAAFSQGLRRTRGIDASVSPLHAKKHGRLRATLTLCRRVWAHLSSDAAYRFMRGSLLAAGRSARAARSRYYTNRQAALGRASASCRNADGLLNTLARFWSRPYVCQAFTSMHADDMGSTAIAS